MSQELLSGVFRSYVENRTKVGQISSSVDSVIKSALNSEFGRGLENSDGFTDTPTDRQISTIRMNAPDGYGESSEVVIEIFAEGRAVVSATRFRAADQEVQHQEIRTIHYGSQEPSEAVAARVLAAIVDTNENAVCDAFSDYAQAALSDNAEHRL